METAAESKKTAAEFAKTAAEFAKTAAESDGTAAERPRTTADAGNSTADGAETLLVVVRFAAEDGHGAVKLLDKEEAHHLMAEGHLRK